MTPPRAGRFTIPWRTLAALALIMVAVLLPGNEIPDGPGMPGLDKIAHFCLFALLATVAHIDFGLDSRRNALLGFLAAIALAVGTELSQLAVPGRSAEAADAAADLAGFLCGWLTRRIGARLLTKAPRRT